MVILNKMHIILYGLLGIAMFGFFLNISLKGFFKDYKEVKIKKLSGVITKTPFSYKFLIFLEGFSVVVSMACLIGFIVLFVQLLMI